MYQLVYYAILVILMICFINLPTNVVAESSDPVPKFPLQFRATITITAHLIDAAEEYPPRTRRMTVYYDYNNKRARAEIESGYEAAKVYVRRYDEKNEYMVRLPPINDCKRSYLGEVMPFPDIPDTEFIGVEAINGVLSNHFIYKDYDTIVHVYLAEKDHAPVRLIQESIVDGVSIPLLTYDYSDVKLGEPDAQLFNLPVPHTHKSCVRHVGGFPYQHIFHYFVKFWSIAKLSIDS